MLSFWEYSLETLENLCFDLILSCSFESHTFWHINYLVLPFFLIWRIRLLFFWVVLKRYSWFNFISVVSEMNLARSTFQKIYPKQKVIYSSYDPLSILQYSSPLNNLLTLDLLPYYDDSKKFPYLMAFQNSYLLNKNSFLAVYYRRIFICKCSIDYFHKYVCCFFGLVYWRWLFCFFKPFN